MRSPRSVVAALAIAATSCLAAEADLDSRVHALSQQLRCVVCQNQTLADSNAELAVDLRRQIRQQLAQGADEQAVKDYVVQRYGDFVLYRPPLKPMTWLLWFGPLLLLAFVVTMLVRARRRQAAAKEPLLDAEQRRGLDALLRVAPGQEPPP